MLQNKVLILFLIKFFASYFIMLGIYNFYLSKTQKKENGFMCAPITKKVADQSALITNFLGYKTEIIQHKNELSFKVLLNNRYIARVIEGCSGISVTILFLAFIIAFSGKLKHTIFFGLIGGLLIYMLNIVRVALLNIGLYEFPKYQNVLHDLVFPAVIYGFIALLWLIWIKKYAQISNE